MRAHLHLTAFLLALSGAMLLALALLAGPLSNAAATSLITAGSEDGALAAALIQWTGRTVAIGGVVLGLPALLCAWGIVRRKAWARWLGIFLAALAVVQIPIGTLAGGYILWVLLSRRFEPWFDDPAATKA